MRMAIKHDNEALLSLPPHKEGRDRIVRGNPDGSIVYERDNPEPPKDINGYERDPNDPYRFVSLWPVCLFRYATGIRLVLCGCINIITRCNNPQAPLFCHRVTHIQCRDCQERQQ